MPAASPRDERARNQPRGDRVSPAAISACATSAAARPGMSLIGRRPDIQNSGHAASSAAPQVAPRGCGAASIETVAPRQHSATAPASADHRLSVSASAAV